MKNIIITFCVIALFGFNAQNDFRTLDNSIEKAKVENKNIILLFSGSDWCKPCILLKRNILDTEEFKTYSSEQFITLHLDFPYKKANQLSKEQTVHNEQVAELFNQDGIFPRVVIINTDNVKLGEIQYGKSMSTDKFITQLKEFEK